TRRNKPEARTTASLPSTSPLRRSNPDRPSESLKNKRKQQSTKTNPRTSEVTTEDNKTEKNSTTRLSPKKNYRLTV
ncbi:hypothetical protein ACCS75_35395, partial [Rhizobium ruizarguesonis]